VVISVGSRHDFGFASTQRHDELIAKLAKEAARKNAITNTRAIA